MIKLSVMYPTTDGASFDHDYYRDHHVPLCLELWGLDSAEIERGVDGPYVAAVHFRFDSVEAMSEVISHPRTAEIMSDLPNYTTITPVRQLSEIVD